MTGSRAQFYNGLVLLATFFSCRLVWGTYQSVRVYQDVWAALQNPGTHHPSTYRNPTTTGAPPSEEALMMGFAGPQVIPLWLAITYLGSNVILNTLNFFWFGKMIETVKKRFQKPKGGGKAGVQVDKGSADGEGNTIAVDEKKRKEAGRRRKA